VAAAPLVLAIGNRQRGDDALGLVVADSLRARLGDRLPGLARLRCTAGDAVGLLQAWEGEDRVLVIDAMAAPPGSGCAAVLRLDAAAGTLPALREAASTHGLGLAEAVELARCLGRLPEVLLVFAVGGENFGRGAPLSPKARAALPLAVEAVAAELDILAAEDP
jgi:hydrogenase maturation protease